MRLRILVFEVFQFFHKHIRSLRRIQPSKSSKILFVSANAKYPHHPSRYWLSFLIRYSIGYGIFLDVISRTFFFIRFRLCLAIRTFGSFEGVKLNPRNFRFHGRSTADFFSLTFRRSFPSINRLTLAMVLSPARFDFT